MFKNYKYKYETAMLLLIVGLMLMLTLSPRDPLISLIHKLLIIADIVLMFSTLRKLWQHKWRKFVAKKAHDVIVRVVEFFLRVSGKWNLTNHKKNVIFGKTEVEFNFERVEKQNQQKSKGKKWRQLETPRERLRYIYRQTVIKQIKHGERIYPQDTPKDLRDRDINQEGERAMFDLYTTYRYDERHEPDGKTVTDLKEKYFPDMK